MNESAMKSRTRHCELIITAWALFSFGLAAFAAPAKPNVLFIAVDDLNDWVGCFGGNPQVKTPNLDRLADDGGLVMMNAYAPSTVCGPSRSSILTGAHCYRTGVYGNQNNLKNAPKAKDLVTLPEYFSQHGYYTISMGKIFHSHPVPGSEERDDGQWAFDEWHKWLGGVGPESAERPVSGIPNLPEETGYHRKAFDWGPTKGNDEKLMRDHRTASWAADQLNTRDFDGKPFFMAIGFTQPHLQWYLPQKYFDMYPLDDVDLPKTLANDRDDIIDDKGRPLYHTSTTWARMEKYGKHREAVRAYLAAVTFVDECIGVLLDGLARSSYADNTIVVLWGDHGWNLGDHTLWCKHSCYESSLQIPLLVRAPGIQGGQRRSALIETIDVYPSLCTLAGIPLPEHLAGQSFVELMRNPDTKWKEAAVSRFRNGDTIRTDALRYTEYTNPKGKRTSRMLYDHSSDPLENQNVAEKRTDESQTLSKQLNQIKGRDGKPGGK